MVKDLMTFSPTMDTTYLKFNLCFQHGKVHRIRGNWRNWVPKERIASSHNAAAATSMMKIAQDRDFPNSQRFERKDVFSIFWALTLVGQSSRAEASIWGGENISTIFENLVVKQPQFDPNAREDIAYPEWLDGTWTCASEMTGFVAPLGNRFLGSVFEHD